MQEREKLALMMPIVAKKLFEEGKTKEEARAYLRQKFLDPDHERRKTIVMKIKKYLKK